MTNRLMGTLLAGALALAGCSDNATSQMSARDQAAAHTCDRAQACGLIGAGLTYETRDDCDVKARGNLQTTWPPAECDGHIDDTQLAACLAGIDAVQCASAGTDVVLLFSLGACAKARVCSGGSPG